MGIIRILPEHEIHKIAAGQVVERPASVVKELIENSLDAGATVITITIKNGGKTFIRVADNGCGMDTSDAYACLKNHATSKITSVNDLMQIQTFGFRGEALASIAAISRLRLKTRQTEQDTGLQITVDGGSIIAEEIVACPVGTEITVEDIFFNTPGRQKFLKKDETEWRAIASLVNASALQHKGCCFSLFHDERHIIHAPIVTSNIERMIQLMGADIGRDLITGKNEYHGLALQIEGIMARPTRYRYDKNQIYVFVNRRPVKNHKLITAFIKGYNNILPAGKNPIGALFITIAPEEIDVNIHPRKDEVRFTHPITVERCIQEMVEKALNDDIKQIAYPMQKSDQFTPAKVWQPSYRPDTFSHVTQAAPAPGGTTTCKAETEPFFIQQKGLLDVPVNEQIENETYRYQLIGQTLNTYIIIEIDEGLLLIDQHAAHERILYELFDNRFDEKTSTQLIFPIIITLSNDEAHLLNEHIAPLRFYGIDIEAFGSNTFTIRAVPVYLKDAPFDIIIKTFITWIDEERPITSEDFSRLLNEKLRALMACKAAIKAGDRLTTTEMHELITKLMACKQSTTCPHGRPTIHRISSYEIEKFFQRCS